MSFRGDARHRTRNLEIPGLVLAHHPGMTASNSSIINAIVSGGIPLFAVFSDAYLNGMSRSNACAAARFGRTVDVKFRSRFLEEIELP